MGVENNILDSAEMKHLMSSGHAKRLTQDRWSMTCHNGRHNNERRMDVYNRGRQVDVRDAIKSKLLTKARYAS